MSRSYPRKERGLWRMYCDSCGHIDPERFSEQPRLEHFAAKGWLIGRLVDRCPQCRTRPDLPEMEVHSVMSGYA